MGQTEELDYMSGTDWIESDQVKHSRFALDLSTTER
jgi:hypothetical protein